jgi:hypothetical protein
MAPRILALVVVAASVAVANVIPASQAETTNAAAVNPLVGTWSRVTTCAQLVAVLDRTGLEGAVLDSIAGNGFVPGVTRSDQFADSAHPCAGAVPRRHSHVFTAGGRFGSLDWKGNPVDDGTYRIGKNHIVTIGNPDARVRFHYRIVDGKTLMLTPVLPACAAQTCFAAVWSVSVAYQGKPWKRTR